MILRALSVCFGLVFAGSAVADTCDELSQTPAERENIERIPAREAFQRSEGQIVFMDADNLFRFEVLAVITALERFCESTRVGFQVIPIISTDTEEQSFICYNAQGCYPITSENIITSLSSLDEFSAEHGLVEN